MRGLNENKSTHVKLTNRRIKNFPVSINDTQVPHATSAKYLSITAKEEKNLALDIENYRKLGVWMCGKLCYESMFSISGGKTPSVMSVETLGRHSLWTKGCGGPRTAADT